MIALAQGSHTLSGVCFIALVFVPAAVALTGLKLVKIFQSQAPNAG